MSNSKNDLAWVKVFEKYKILNKISAEGYAVISAKQINEFREARLMTKFDHKSQLPILFAENKLSILPVSRGGYVIGTFETFYTIGEEDFEVSSINFPTFLESLDYRDITSEATAINCAFVSKILHDFTGEENLLPTVSGRMSSASFGFNINYSNGIYSVTVDNSQVEIDGGYEGDNSLALIEAKNYISSDFLVRQLFYPFKLWNKKIQKQVRPIFLTYSNGVFHLREYLFTDVNYYNSLKLVQHKKYVVQAGAFNLELLQQILERINTVREPEVPFPQADSFERVVNLCELLNQRGFISKEDITQNYDFDARQTDYYSNAGRYLGLISIENDRLSGQIGCLLTSKGKQLFNLSLVDRQKEFVRLILGHASFKKTMIAYLESGEMPDKDSIVDIMRRAKLYKVESDTTFYRRASTIAGWVSWIVSQVEE